MSLESRTIRRKYKNIDDFLNKEAEKHRCACGCKQVIELKKSHYWNGIPRFIFGHAARLRAGGPEYDRKHFYSVTDIAEISKASEQTVRLWMRSGKIVPDKVIGRKNLFIKESIDTFIETYPKRKPFLSIDYISVKELKKLGIARSKLRVLVREGKVQEPRIHARKTHYLKEEIEKFKDAIMEDRKIIRPRSRYAVNIYKEIADKLVDLERRVMHLEGFQRSPVELTPPPPVKEKYKITRRSGSPKSAQKTRKS